MTHLWVRAEQRSNETRVGLTPEGAAKLIAAGITVTIEDSPTRCIPTDRYANAGATIAAQNTCPDAPADAIIFGLKELPEDGSPQPHKHIMFGHAFKGQPSGQRLLRPALRRGVVPCLIWSIWWIPTIAVSRPLAIGPDMRVRLLR